MSYRTLRTDRYGLNLSPAERDALVAVVTHGTYRAAGIALGLSVDGVKSRIVAAREKLRARSTTHAVVLAWPLLGDCYLETEARRVAFARRPDAFSASSSPADTTWRCDWQPDDLNPGPDCPYCEGLMCARFDGIDGCSHGRVERHGYT